MASWFNQCISAKTQNQIPHCKPELKETISWTTVGQSKDISSKLQENL